MSDFTKGYIVGVIVMGVITAIQLLIRFLVVK